MTEKDKELQELKRRVCVLENALNELVEDVKACRYCKYLDADCSPTGECRPEWRGV